MIEEREQAQEQAQVLGRAGNVAVTQLEGRHFPGVHLQGDTFNGVLQQISDAARQLRESTVAQEDGPLDELDDAVERMAGFLSFYEGTLADRGLKRPY